MRSRPLPHATCSTSQCCPSSASANACSARCFHPRGAKVAWEPSDGTTLGRTRVTAFRRPFRRTLRRPFRGSRRAAINIMHSEACLHIGSRMGKVDAGWRVSPVAIETFLVYEHGLAQTRARAKDCLRRLHRQASTVSALLIDFQHGLRRCRQHLSVGAASTGSEPTFGDTDASWSTTRSSCGTTGTP